MKEIDRATLLTDEWFNAIPSDRRDLLLHAGRVSRLNDGASIYASGELPNGLWAVLAGQVRLKGYPTPGLEMLVLSLVPGEWFGEMSVIDGGVRPHDAIAHGHTRLLHVPMAAFLRLAADAPLLYLDVGRLVCRHERLALEFIARFAVPPRARVARLILAHRYPIPALATTPGGHGGDAWAVTPDTKPASRRARSGWRDQPILRVVERDKPTRG